jgi:hypothetical protein
MATANQIWPINTDAKVVLSGLKDDAGAYIEDAAVVGTMKDENGNVVANATNLNFEYVGANGVYSVIIPSNADILPERTYTFFITAVKAARKALLKMTRQAAYIEI